MINFPVPELHWRGRSLHPSTQHYFQTFWLKFGTEIQKASTTMNWMNLDMLTGLYNNEEVEYSFSTILPSKYLNGNPHRPPIFIAEWHKHSMELISQIYFKGNPKISKNPWASSNKAEHRTLQPSPVGTSGNLTVYLDTYPQKIENLNGGDGCSLISYQLHLARPLNF